jgi:hypothetical protein
MDAFSSEDEHVFMIPFFMTLNGGADRGIFASRVE